MMWISVEDRLPEEHKHVLAYSITGTIHPAYLSMIGGTDPQWTIAGFGGAYFLHDDSFGFITHWMPLPEPPESEE
jgi:hypothetical protein